MRRETVIILGVPIDDLTLGEAVDRIFAMVDEYRTDGVPRQVATVNVDFIVNTLTWQQGGIRHPELLDILRRADMVTADGMPVVWMSRLLGCPIRERVTGADLVPALTAGAARRGVSVYFLGGRSGIGQRAADILKNRDPDLKIAGISSPFVHTEGEHLTDFEAEDAAIVEEINGARPDILLIAFGNPKQELWFARNAPRLKVPVSIGIGGTFEFIAGTVSRAPLWVQQAGLEWIYRIMMEPRRLWKRYAVGLVRFGLHAWPAIRSYRRGRVLCSRDAAPDSAAAGAAMLVEEEICVIAIPKRLDAQAAKQLEPLVEESAERYRHLIFNFEEVQLIDSAGLGFLVGLWRRGLTEGRRLNFISVAPPVMEFLRFNRVADLFRERLFTDRKQALNRIRQEGLHPLSPCEVSYLRSGTAIVALRGRLDAAAMRAFPFDEVLPQLSGRDCILDLTGLDFADSTGLVAFHRIQRHVVREGHSCTLCAPREPVMRLLRLTRLDRLFTITDNQLVLIDRRER